MQGLFLLTNYCEMLYAKNDSPRLKEELRRLGKENKPLLDLIVDLYHHIEDILGKDTVITMIYRTSAEQDAIYGKSKKYKKKKFTSPHQYWQAMDIRSKSFTKDEVKSIEKYLNDKYNDTNYYKWSAKDHKVGKGASHFHIQYLKK